MAFNMEIIYFFAFFVGAYLLAVLLAGNARDIEDREDPYPPRHRPLLVVLLL